MTDYPAAHSMDSTWFAVDADGEVGFFDTGEGGAAPMTGFPLGGEAGAGNDDALESSDLIAIGLRLLARDDERLRELLPEDDDELRTLLEDGMDYELADPLLRAVGVHTFSCLDQAAVPYTRLGEVPRPLRLDQLPPDLIARFVDARLPVRFAELEVLQPAEFAEVEAWGDHWISVAGKVHTIPGRSPDPAVAEEMEEWAEAWQDDAYEPEVEPVLEGDAFYDAVAEVLGGARKDREHRARVTEERAASSLFGRLKAFFGL